MATFKNTTAGPKGVNTTDMGLVFIVGGTSEELKVSDAEMKSAKATGWFEIEGKAEDDGDKADGPDYERDGLKDVDIRKPATSKDVLLVIAAYEGADVPESGEATKAELIKAIEAKRAA